MSNERIPVALIGCGTVAQYGHLPTIAENPILDLVAVSDVHEPTLQDVANRYGAKPYADYHELLASPEIVAVTVSTQLPQHFEVAADALKAGKHVFVEKPLADTPEHCAELVDLARQHNRMLAVNFEYRIDEGVLKMRELIQSGELGELQVVRFINNWSAHGVQGTMGARRARFMQEGGGAMDCGIHFLDLARFLSGSDVRSMSAMGQWVEPEFKWPGHILIQARMENGVMAFIESSFTYTHRSQTKVSFMQYEVIGSKGVATWTTPPRTPGCYWEKHPDELHILTDEHTEVMKFSTDKQFTSVYADWAQCLQRGSMEGSSLATGFDGSQATRWMWDALDQTLRERGQ